ncbi:MAG: glycerophosphodiester phosphodiesterase family protein [Planctomycetota bacterium]|nr:glycerophosphodiester phosphodiesterase family protein [Planctomycetota bacterium]
MHTPACPNFPSLRVRSGSRVLAIAAALGVGAPALAQSPTLWNFDNPGNRLMPTFGPGTISYRGTSINVTQFGTCTAFGIPLLPGGDSGVMRVPAYTASQGLLVDHNTPANGAHIADGWVSNYTLLFDLLIPASSFAAPRSLYNTNLTNANDGDAFINAAGAIGLGSVFCGQLQPDTWHRVAVVAGAGFGEGLFYFYIDGAFVGALGGTGGGIGSRHALYANTGADQGFILFGDDNTQTGVTYVSSFMYVDERLSETQIAALGRPTAAGLGTPGAPPVATPGTAASTGVIAHRGNSGHAPENTLASVDQALDLCVDAIEIDVRLSADGQVVLMHDTTLDRTTDQTGNANARTAAQLAQADAGEWFSRAYDAEPVPTLVQALLLAKQKGGRLYLDVKVSGAGPAINAALQQAGVPASDIWLWAYNDANITEFFQTIPGARIVCDQVPTTPAAMIALRDRGVVGFDYGWGSSAINPTQIALAHAHGLFVSAYTLDSPAQILGAIAAGVDYFETDFPAFAYSLMQSRPACCAADPDYTRDGNVDQDDIACLAQVIAGDASCSDADPDFNRDGNADQDDIAALEQVVAGAPCP